MKTKKLVKGFVVFVSLVFLSVPKAMAVPCPADIDCNGTVNMFDLIIMKNNYNESGCDRFLTCPCEGTLSAGGRWCDQLDGMVKDMTTGLVWLKDAGWGGNKPWRNSSTDCSGPDYTCYDDAHTRAGILDNGTSGAGLSDGSVEGDWRLPTKTELLGLANGSEAVRYASPQLFIDVQSYYWSSTSSASYPYYAWYVYMDDGYAYYGYKPSTNHYVWPVRPDN